MLFPSEILVLAASSLVVSALGWKKFVYFISLGYGFSIAVMGLLMLVLFMDSLSVPSVLLSLLLVAYGCRLGGFLLHRELRSASYRKELPSLTKTSKDLGPGAKIAIWLSVVVLYVCQVSPVFYRLSNGTDRYASEGWAWAGAAVMLAALVLESVADSQKSASKKLRPDRFCDTGLFRIVRCPNYFAEILFWTGCLISGIGTLSGWLLAHYGFQANMVQDEAVLGGIRSMMGILPAVACAVSSLCVAFYPLSEKKVLETSRRLAALRDAGKHFEGE